LHQECGRPAVNSTRTKARKHANVAISQAQARRRAARGSAPVRHLPLVGRPHVDNDAVPAHMRPLLPVCRLERHYSTRPEERRFRLFNDNPPRTYRLPTAGTYRQRREAPIDRSSPKCFRTLVVKIEKTNSNSTRDFSKRINFNRVDPFVGSTLVVKIKKNRNPLRAFTEDKENIILLPVDWGLSSLLIVYF